MTTNLKLTLLYYPRAVHRFLMRWHVLDNIPKNSIGAELGVFKGQFSKQILRERTPSILYLVDTWDPYFDNDWKDVNMEKVYQSLVSKYQTDPRVQILRSTTRKALISFPNEYLDWVYVDADHSEQAVYDDLCLSYQKVKPNGLIMGDDYHRTKHPGVKLAVNKFIKAYPVSIRSIRSEQYILQKDVLL